LQQDQGVMCDASIVSNQIAVCTISQIELLWQVSDIQNYVYFSRKH